MYIGNLSNLELLIHCHVSQSVHPRHDALAIKEGIAFLLRHEMIVQDDRHYSTTPKGAFYLDHLKLVPLPKVSFSIPKE